MKQIIASRRSTLGALAVILGTGLMARSGLASVGVAQQVASPRPLGFMVDALCYELENPKAEIFGDVLKAGLSAAVFDISPPREYDTAIRELGIWQQRFLAEGAQVRLVSRRGDFARAKSERKIGIVLASQDASVVGSSLADFHLKLQILHSLGLRVLQLTHNSRNHWGDSYLEKRDGGLSVAGSDLVSKMNRLGMIVDLSHCSKNTLFDAVAVSTAPCVVTHAGCRALANTARNKSDAEIKALGDKGGFFGVFNVTPWLTSRDTVKLDTVIDHIDHAVQLIGPWQVGFGSDGALGRLDITDEKARMTRVQQLNNGSAGAEWPVRHVRVAELNSPDRMTALAEGLSRRGYSSDHVDGVTGGNFVRIFESICRP